MFLTDEEIDLSVKFLKDNNINIGGEVGEYMDEGGEGIVFEIKGTNKVIKFEPPSARAKEAYDKIIEHKPENVVRTYLCSYLLGTMALVMERLDPLPEDFFHVEDLLDHILYVIEDIDLNHTEDPKLIRQFVEDFLEDVEDEQTVIALKRLYFAIAEQGYHGIVQKVFQYELKKETSDRINILTHAVPLFIDAYKGAFQLKELGIKHNDFHSNNILYDKKTDTYKIIDPHVHH